MKYEVESAFIDKNTKEAYAVGSHFETDSEDRAEFLQKKGFLGSEIDSAVETILDKKATDIIKEISTETSKEELESLLNQEVSGKNRVTVKEHIEKLLNGEDHESSEA
ncbi:hypothetical protein AS888_20915 [Peribacillus simplex]|uniref:Uncharacterized protein n=1 Tax=Peribacillus simplex TaxID=1478 RepID=A0A109MXL3_9BACI|nr:hypothetical protein [Peribacillus simplex]KWW17975.1 hypothetical protein AS888_20915 [Peribacillus simplex]